jgi:hypothetical protein
MILHFPTEYHSIRAIEEKFVELYSTYRQQPSMLLAEEVDWMDWANNHLIMCDTKSQEGLNDD